MSGRALIGLLLGLVAVLTLYGMWTATKQAIERFHDDED